MEMSYTGIALFTQALVFGGLALSDRIQQITHRLRFNLNNFSDGLLIGLVFFSILPHAFSHVHHLQQLWYMVLILPLGALAWFSLQKQSNLLLASLLFLTHTFAEGFALGCQWGGPEFHSILFSIVIHKGIESFCFTRQLSLLSPSLAVQALLLLLLASMTPLGFVLGYYLQMDLHHWHNAEPLLDLLTALCLLLVIAACQNGPHKPGCQPAWNGFNYLGLVITAAVSLCTFQLSHIH